MNHSHRRTGVIAALGVLLITGYLGPRKGPEIEGIRYFAGRSGDGNTTCISAVVDQTPLNWITGCGGAPNSLREIVTTGLNGVVTVMLVGDNVDTSDFIKDGMQPIHDNVLIAKP